MIIDGRVYLGASLFQYGQTVSELLENMDRLSIDQAVLVPVKPRNYHLEPANDLVAEPALTHPDRFLHICRVDPWQEELALAEVRRCVQERNACGIYLDPWEENFQINDEIVFPIVETASHHQKPILINAGHGRVSHPSQISDLASQFPKVKFVASNGGQINISGGLLGEARRMLETCPNVVIETAGTYREDFLEEIVTEVGEESVLFASGSPIYDQEFEMARVRFAHLEEEQKQKLWATNALRIYGTRQDL